MRMPKIWNIVRGFKELCRRNGWKISENEDWIKINETYHQFVYARDITPSSFEKITTNHKCIVPEGLSYRVVNASYTAWLFSQTPSANIIKAVCENPDFSKNVAVYDLSLLLEGKNLCTRLNNTDSPVFQEFENFLANNFNAKIEQLRTSSTSAKDVAIEELA